VQAALEALVARFPRLAGRVFDEVGQLHNGLNVFVNREAIRYRGNMSARLHDGDEIYIVPMMAGG
jgi:molybdopterin converting factor small subunit